MPSITEIIANRIAGLATPLIAQDANGYQYKLVPHSTYRSWDVLRNNSVVGFPARRAVVAKTADYTVKVTDTGTMFTTTGATGAVNFTLPTAVGNAGIWFEFMNTVDQNMTITSTPADAMVVFNDVAADSIAFSTVAEKVGGSVRVTSDGSKWLAQVMLGSETQTPTIAT